SGFSPFFFSSRRRHTRWPRDWSSDVCSSDLNPFITEIADIYIKEAEACSERGASVIVCALPMELLDLIDPDDPDLEDGDAGDTRSEERRVGKECRSRSSTYDEKEKWIVVWIL